MATSIIQQGDSVLHTIAKDIPISNISTPKIQKYINSMSEALAKEQDGVALAAPQIGIPLRIFVIAPNIVSKKKNISSAPVSMEKQKKKENLVYINPRVIKHSRKKVWVEEGCLSVRWYYGETERYERLTVEAYDEHGKKFTRGAGGLSAQIIQHEIDHLNGTLFIDHGRKIRKLSEKEIAKYKKELYET